jgi:hypothetical protein
MLKVAIIFTEAGWQSGKVAKERDGYTAKIFVDRDKELR